MFMYLYESNIIFYILAGLTGTALIFEFINQLAYIRLSKIVNNITNTEDKTMKKLKFSYEEKRKKNEIVYSVDNFVDKYVNNFKYCGMKLCTLEKFCGQLIIIVGLSIILCSVYAGYAVVDKNVMLLTIMLGIVCIGLLILFRSNVDKFKVKKKICIDIVDFLENTYRKINTKTNDKFVENDGNYINKKDVKYSKDHLNDKISKEKKEDFDIEDEERLSPREKIIRVNKIDNCEKAEEKAAIKEEHNKVSENELIDEILKEFLM